MKKYPKLVQCDARGQIVIPKEVRTELNIDEGSGFFMYIITDEGILLKKVEEKELNPDDPIMKSLNDKAIDIGVKKENLQKSVESYKKKTKRGLELI